MVPRGPSSDVGVAGQADDLWDEDASRSSRRRGLQLQGLVLKATTGIEPVWTALQAAA
jgi:hypothetical protein